MQFEIYGGNDVCRLGADIDAIPADLLFSSTPYSYRQLKLQPGETFASKEMQSLTLFVLKTGFGGKAQLSGGETLSEGDSAQIELRPIEVTAIKAPIVLLIAGIQNSPLQTSSLIITRGSAQYLVNKPWGHERWLNGQHPGYCLKEVMIRQGHRTSLQYHNFKEETNVLFFGTAKLIYKHDAAVPNNLVEPKHLSSLALSAVSVIHMKPPILHRLEATTDIILYEVSTPFLDDVIRVQDDRKRENGRIVSEHAKV